MQIIKYKIVWLAIIGMLSSYGCNRFLEVDVVGRTTIPNFFADVNGLKAGLFGCYSEMFSYYSGDFYKYPEVAGNMVDLILTNTDEGVYNQFNFTSTPLDETGAPGYIWRHILETLANVNNVLEYAPILKNKFPEEQRTIELIEAQALFMRALCHFDLCRVYGQPYNYTADASHLAVPVLTITPGPEDLPARKSAKAVYDQIINDLLESERLFADTPMQDAYHISKTATQALLSRVYLYKNDIDNTIRYSTLVIGQIPLAHGEDYINMYTGMIAGKEAIFRLNGTLKSQQLAIKFYSTTEPVAYPADTLISLYTDKTDIRLQLLQPNPKVNSKYITLKYYIRDQTISQEKRHYDPFVLRASEMYLNRAEAYLLKNQPEKAIDDLKILYARALSKPATEIEITYSSVEELAQLLKRERAKELCFEGHQFFDIIRQKDNLNRGATTTSTVKFLPYPNDLFVLPIPQSELNANKNMVGNPTVNN